MDTEGHSIIVSGGGETAENVMSELGSYYDEKFFFNNSDWGRVMSYC